MNSSHKDEIKPYARDLSDLAWQSKLDPFIGRTAEINLIFQVLSRRESHSPLLVGDNGVGKTAIIEGLAEWIIDSLRHKIRANVPEWLRDRHVYALDLNRMIQGTRDRGQLEGRLLSVIDNSKSRGNIILSLGHLAPWVIPGAGRANMGHVWKSAMAMPMVRIIAEATDEEHREIIAADRDWGRLLRPITIRPPDRAETLDILRSWRDGYEMHHQVSYTDESLEAAVDLSNRSISQRCQPAKAIDTIDEAGVLARFEQISMRSRPEEIDRQIEDLTAKKEAAITAGEFDEASIFKRQVDQLIHVRKDGDGRGEGVVDEKFVALAVVRLAGI